MDGFIAFQMPVLYLGTPSIFSTPHPIKMYTYNLCYSHENMSVLKYVGHQG